MATYRVIQGEGSLQDVVKQRHKILHMHTEDSSDTGPLSDQACLYGEWSIRSYLVTRSSWGVKGSCPALFLSVPWGSPEQVGGWRSEPGSEVVWFTADGDRCQRKEGFRTRPMTGDADPAASDGLDFSNEGCQGDIRPTLADSLLLDEARLAALPRFRVELSPSRGGHSAANENPANDSTSCHWMEVIALRDTDTYSWADGDNPWVPVIAQKQPSSQGGDLRFTSLVPTQMESEDSEIDLAP